MKLRRKAAHRTNPGLGACSMNSKVLALVPVSRTTLFRLEKKGRFPRSTYISPNRRVWFEDQVVAWQNAVDELDPNRGRGKGRRRGVASSVVGRARKTSNPAIDVNAMKRR
jgi:prophage regulatory protein